MKLLGQENDEKAVKENKENAIKSRFRSSWLGKLAKGSGTATFCHSAFELRCVCLDLRSVKSFGGVFPNHRCLFSRGLAEAIMAHNSSAFGSDGRLWFARGGVSKRGSERFALGAEGGISALCWRSPKQNSKFR